MHNDRRGRDFICARACSPFSCMGLAFDRVILQCGRGWLCAWKTFATQTRLGVHPWWWPDARARKVHVRPYSPRPPATVRAAPITWELPRLLAKPVHASILFDVNRYMERRW